MGRFWRLAVAALAALVLPAFTAASAPLFKDGATEWSIATAKTPSPEVAYAARELQTMLLKISGATFPVRGFVPKGASVIYVGDLGDPMVSSIAGELGLSASEDEQAVVRLYKPNRLVIAGNQPRAALHAAYAFLQNQLGVRWLWPGADGEFYPRLGEWEVPADLAYRHVPRIRYRGYHLCGDWRGRDEFVVWMARNYLNVHRHGTARDPDSYGFHRLFSSHNATLPRSLFAEHPEYFALLKNERSPVNICFSNENTVRLVAENLSKLLDANPKLEILQIFPADNQDYCQCPDCSRLGVSTAWFTCYNKITDILKERHPGVKFSTLAYQGYGGVPDCPVKNSVFIEYATHSRCHTHKYTSTTCRRNAEVLKRFEAWRRKGVDVGEYSYEFDAFTAHPVFIPFFSLIEDSVETALKFGHVTIIPEIGLSPKDGPETGVHNVINRLPLHFYAQKMWDPDLPFPKWAEDMCATAFGPAKDPMSAYFRAIDRAWTVRMKCTGMLGDSLGSAMSFLNPVFEARAEKCFAEAFALLGGEEATSRHAENVGRERLLFRKWLSLKTMNDADATIINMPCYGDAMEFDMAAPRGESLGASAQAVREARVSCAWTRPDAEGGGCLLVRVAPLKVAEMKPGDAIGFSITPSDGDSSTFHFSIAPDLAKSAYSITEAGRRTAFTGDWKVSPAAGGLVIEVPFKALGVSPGKAQVWRAEFSYATATPPPAFAKSGPGKLAALLRFTGLSVADRKLVWWCGSPDRDSGTFPAIRNAAEQAGWKATICTTEKQLSEAFKEGAEVFWLRNPFGSSPLPERHWSKLSNAVKGGAVAIFASYWNVRLDDIFGKDYLKTSVESAESCPLALRRPVSVAPGDWGLVPHDLAAAMKSEITPAYGHRPESAKRWKVLATERAGNKPPLPYVMACPFGKGLVVLLGDDLRISPMKFVDNFANAAKMGEFADGK